MKRKFRREILSKTRRIALISNSKNEQLLKCEICREDSIFLSPVMVAGLLKISTREIYRLIEEGLIHFFENDSKELSVCFNSLVNALSDKKREGE